MLSFLLCLHNSKVATGGDLAVVDSYAGPESELSAAIHHGLAFETR